MNRGIIKPHIAAVIHSEGYSAKLKGHVGKLGLSLTWIGGILQSMGLSFRNATSAAQKLPVNFEEFKHLFILRCGEMTVEFACSQHDF